jgi:hypothetical protein
MLQDRRTLRTESLRENNDGSFVPHQIGAISSTFTSDWYLHKGESRDKMEEWLKKATIRSQDQWRILQPNTHNFPSNDCRNKITKGKESNKCDLCRALWIVEGRFNTEDELPIQTLGHIHHQYETLSEIHTRTPSMPTYHSRRVASPRIL